MSDYVLPQSHSTTSSRQCAIGIEYVVTHVQYYCESFDLPESFLNLSGCRRTRASATTESSRKCDIYVNVKLMTQFYFYSTLSLKPKLSLTSHHDTLPLPLRQVHSDKYISICAPAASAARTTTGIPPVGTQASDTVYLCVT